MHMCNNLIKNVGKYVPDFFFIIILNIQEIISRIPLVQNFNIGKFFANELKHPQIIRSEDQLLSNKSPRLGLVLLFANNWSSDLIYGCFRSLAKNFPIKNFALGI
jgi:hypothetical protein